MNEVIDQLNKLKYMSLLSYPEKYNDKFKG